MTVDLSALVEAVDSLESFLAFLKALEKDRKAALEEECISPSSPFGPGPGGLENGSIESFLEAMHAWASDSPLLSDEACWKEFAMLLMAGKTYE